MNAGTIVIAPPRSEVSEDPWDIGPEPEIVGALIDENTFEIFRQQEAQTASQHGERDTHHDVWNPESLVPRGPPRG